jgi:hypothetical protein
MTQYHLPNAQRIAHLDPFDQAYIEAMFWTSCDDTPNCPEDECSVLRYGSGAHNLTRASLAAIVADCAAFRERAGALLDGADPERAGVDFWLTREGHGTGFWDRLPDTYPNDPEGEALTALAKQFGEVTGAGCACQVGRWVHYV